VKVLEPHPGKMEGWMAAHPGPAGFPGLAAKVA